MTVIANNNSTSVNAAGRGTGLPRRLSGLQTARRELMANRTVEVANCKSQNRTNNVAFSLTCRLP
jgi:hypothetical protein